MMSKRQLQGLIRKEVNRDKLTMLHYIYQRYYKNSE